MLPLDRWRFDLGTPDDPRVVLSLPQLNGQVPEWARRAAALVVRAVEETCGFRPPEAPPDGAGGAPATRGGVNTIALGSMADNPAIRRHYERFRTLVDRWYPGAGGWVVQPLHQAASGAEGGETIVAGGSDGDGVLRAAGALAEQIRREGRRLRWRPAARLGPEHLPLPEDRIDVLGTGSSEIPTPWSELPAEPYASGFAGGSPEAHLLRLGMFGPHADNSHLSRSSELGLRYLYTTETEHARAYRRTLLEEIRLGVVRHLYHYKSLRMFQLWEILCPSEVFSDADRSLVQEALLDYLRLGTGLASLERIRAQTTAEGVFDRHTACEALNLLVGAGYFHRLTGDPAWLEHREVADSYFRAQTGTDVPHTCLTEGYFTYLEVYLEWLLEAHPEEIRSNPHVRLWADRALGLCTNRGVMVEGVQTEAARFPYGLLRKLTVLLGDGRYRFVADTRHQAVLRGMDRVMQFSAGQAWETRTPVVRPVDLEGLRVFEANRRLHRLRAPGFPVQTSFDRITGRSS